MRKSTIAWRGLVALLLLGMAATAAPGASAQTLLYKKRSLAGGGYRDITITPGRWRIIGETFQDPDQIGVKMAVYRGALLAKANGFPFLMIVNGKITDTYVSGVGSLKADMTMVGLMTRDAPAPCEAEARYVVNCKLLVVDEVIASYGMALNRSPAQQQDDLEAVRNLPLRK